MADAPYSLEVKQLIEELNAAGKDLSKGPVNKNQLSTPYCRKASKALDKIISKSDYNEVITGLWFVAAHLNEHMVYVKPVRALSELCLKLFRQCAKAILNIQWEKLEEDSSLRHNFLTSLTNLHAKLLPLNISRFHLLASLSESPWTHPTLAKVMSGELDDSNKEEVQSYIRNEDPIILQLRVDMMLKENCEEYALNLCNSYLGHPELQSDMGVRKTQFFLLYKLGQEDKLQEECQKLSTKDAVDIIKQLQTKTHRKMCTVLVQTCMVQNWIRPSDLEASKELLRLWIVHQLLVDKEQDQFKESVWAMAKLSQSTDQIILFIDVLRETCGETFLQLYVDMCIFAINVDKGQMEISIKEGNREAAAERRSDMASVCAKLSCLCHQTSIKVARMCALTAFVLKPADQSFAKIGAFYDQGNDCCDKCGRDQNHEQGTINPATLYEVERLLNMLRPDYLSPSLSYADIQTLCRRYLQECITTIDELHKMPGTSESVSDALNVATPERSNAESSVSSSFALFKSFCSQDVQNIQMLLNRMNLQNITTTSSLPNSTTCLPTTNRPIILQNGQSSTSVSVEQMNQIQSILGEKMNSKHTSCEPMNPPAHNQANYEGELQQQQHGSDQISSINVNLQTQQQNPELIQQQSDHKKLVQEIITAALKQDLTTLQRLAQSTSPELFQAVLNIIKMLKPSVFAGNQQQLQTNLQQVNHALSSPKLKEQPLPIITALLHPSLQLAQQQKLPQQSHQQQTKPHLPQVQHIQPQLNVQPFILSTTKKCTPVKTQTTTVAMPVKVHITPSNSFINRSVMTTNSELLNKTQITSTSTTSSASGENQQKSESFLLAKSKVEEIRQFLQAQMSNIQQTQITEPWQMSGSIVTLNSDSKNITTDGPHFIFTGKQPTLVELTKPAALVIPQAQEISTESSFQHLPQKLTCQIEQKCINQGQQLFITPSSRTCTNLNLKPPSSEYQRQPNSTASFGSVQSTAIISKPVSLLPGTTTINNHLIQPVNNQKIHNSTAPQVHGIFTSSHLDTNQFSIPKTPQISSITTIRKQPQKVIGISTLPGSYVQSPSVVEISKCSALYVTTHTLNSINTISQSGLNWKLPIASFPYSKSNNQVPNNQELKSNRITVSVKLPENVPVWPKEATAHEVKTIVVTPGEVDKDAIYRCILCNVAFKTLEHLQVHVKTVCRPGQQPSSTYKAKVKPDKTTDIGMETSTVFQCLRCFELCISNAGIKQHRLICRKAPPIPPGLKMGSLVSEESGALKMTVDNQLINAEPTGIFSNKPVSSEVDGISENQPVNVELKDISGNQPGELNNSNVNQSVKNELNDSYVNSVNGQIECYVNNSVNNELNGSNVNSVNEIYESFVNNSVNNELNGSNINSVNELNESYVSNSVNNELNGSNVNELNESYVNNSVNNELNGSNVNSVNELNEGYVNNSVNNELNCSNVNSVNELNESYVNNSVNSELNDNLRKKSIDGEPSNELVNVEVNDNSQTTPELTPLVQLPTAIPAVKNTTSESAIYPLCPTIQSNCINSHALLLTEDTASQPHVASTTFHPILKHPITDATTENLPTSSVSATNHPCTSKTIAALINKIIPYQATPNPPSINSKIILGVDVITPTPVHTFLNDPLSSPHDIEDNSLVLTKTVIKKMGRTECKIGEYEAKLSFKIEEKAISTKVATLNKRNMRCEICNVFCHTERTLLQHFVIKHLKSYTENKSSDSPSYLCHFCLTAFTTFQQFLHHVRSHSVTIYDKMKVVTTNKLSRNSTRINGLTSKVKANKKIVNSLNSTKVAPKSIINKFKRHFSHKRFRSSKRRHLLPRCASVNNTIIDASSSAPCKPQRVYTRHRLAMIRRCGAKNKELNIKSFCQGNECSIQSPLDQLLNENDQELKGTCNPEDNNRGLNNNYKDAVVHPVTRRKQSFRMKFLPSEKRKTSPPLNMDTYTKGIIKYSKHPGISDSDADSESSDLQFSQSNNGVFMPVSRTEKVRMHSSTAMGKDRVDSQKFEPSRTLFIRSLTKQQKENLQSCNLHPSVVLEVMRDENSKTACQYGNGSSVTKNQHHNTKKKNHPRASEPYVEALSQEISISTSAKSKSSSFLDSYLSYLSQYPFSEAADRPVINVNNNSSNYTQRLPVATNRLGLVNLGGQSQVPGEQANIPVEQSSVIALQIGKKQKENFVTSNEQVKGVQKNILHFPDSNHGNAKNNPSKLCTQHCCVDLDQNLSPKDVTARRNILSQNKITAQDVSLPSISASHIEQDKIAEVISSESLRTDAQKKQGSIYLVKKSGKPARCVKNISATTVGSINESGEFSPQNGHQGAVEQVSGDGDKDVHLQYNSPVCVNKCKMITGEQFENYKGSSDKDNTSGQISICNGDKCDSKSMVAHNSQFNRIKPQISDFHQFEAHISNSHPALPWNVAENQNMSLPSMTVKTLSLEDSDVALAEAQNIIVMMDVPDITTVATREAPKKNLGDSSCQASPQGIEGFVDVISGDSGNENIQAEGRENLVNAEVKGNNNVIVTNGHGREHPKCEQGTREALTSVPKTQKAEEDVRSNTLNISNLNGCLLNNHDTLNDKSQTDIKADHENDFNCFDLVVKGDSANGEKNSAPCVLDKKITTLVPFVVLEKSCSLISASNNPKMTVKENEFSPAFATGDTMAPENNSFHKGSENDSSDKETKLRRKGRSQKWPRNTDSYRCEEKDCFRLTAMEEPPESNKSFTSKRATEHNPQIITKRMRTREIPLTPKFNNGRSVIPLSLPNSQSPVHLTRSSGAAIKAFGQKSLRNREIYPLQQPQSSSPSKQN